MSVTGLALGLFLAAFAGIYIQLATGHDPALAAAAQRRAVTVRSANPSSSKSSGTATSGDTGTTGATSSGGSQSAGSPSAVTTAQS
jgi:hypothetical protein